MRIIVNGQQAFGEAVLRALVERGENVVAVYCAPDKPGARPDPLKVAAESLGLPVQQPASFKNSEVWAQIAALQPDLCVMAFVTKFVPSECLAIPRLGTIQYHPSLLPKYRGPSAINWAIAQGESETGLTIFRPSDGLDEGAVILQKTVRIGPDDTLGQVYFDHLFPMGVQALMEAADLVKAGKHQEHIQDESHANYEGWFNAQAAQLHWGLHIQQLYNLIRAANPAPGAWCLYKGEKVQIFDTRKHLSPTFGSVSGKPGEVTHVTDTALWVACQGGQLEILKGKAPNGQKVSGSELAQALGLTKGAFFDL